MKYLIIALGKLFITFKYIFFQMCKIKWFLLIKELILNMQSDVNFSYVDFCTQLLAF